MAERVPSVSVRPAGAGSVGIVKTGYRQYWYGDRYNYKVTATAEAGWVFSHYEIERIESDGSVIPRQEKANPLEVDWLDGEPVGRVSYGDSSVVAVFEKDTPPVPKYTIMTIPSPSAGGVTTGDGEYEVGESCTIVAMANKGWRFVEWQSDMGGSSRDATYSFSVSYDEVWTAYFEEERPKHTVVTASSPANGGVTIGDGDYYEGDECSVTAMPKPGFAFTEWEIRRKLATGYTVIYRSNEPGFTFTVPPMEDGKPNEVVCVAFFVEDLITITTKANPVAGGKTTGDGKYAPDEECTITATANQGYKFREWVSSLGNRSNEAVHTFVVGDSDEIWTGYFEEIGGYVITVVANPKEGGKPEGGGTYGEGAGCTIAAKPDMRYDFLYWKVDGSDEPVSTEEEYTFSVTRDAVYTAYYRKRTGPWMYYTKVI